MKVQAKCQKAMNNKKNLHHLLHNWRGMITMALLTLSIGAKAQDDFGVNLSVSTEKKFSSRFEGDLSIDSRFQNICEKGYMERIGLGAGLGYKIVNTKMFDLKINAGVEYIRQTKPTELEITTKKKLKVTRQRSFDRIRTSAGFGASFKPNKRWSFLLKETVQYNHYYPHHALVAKFENKLPTEGEKYYIYKDGDTDCHYKYDEDASWHRNVANADDDPEEKKFEAKDRLILRNKLTIKYDIKHSILSPYASCDYGLGLNYNTNKWKVSAGTEIHLSKKHNMDVYYRYQTEDDDDEPNGHLLGVGYILKF